MRSGILVLLLAIFVGLAAAQGSGGQLCVRAFEDRNGNGTQDANEPPLTRGVSATLEDARGVIVASTLIENSPNAASGTLCFQRLEAGQYTVSVSSAEYTPTTVSQYIAVVSAGGVPEVFPYGGQLIPVEAAAPVADGSGDFTLSPAEQRALIVRLIFAAIGALVIMGAMAVVGALLYFFLLRNRQDRPAQASSTAVYPAVPSDTGSYPAAPVDTSIPTGRDTEPRPAYAMYEDTSPPRSTEPQQGDQMPYDEVDDDFQFEDDDNNGDDPDAPFKPPQ